MCKDRLPELHAKCVQTAEVVIQLDKDESRECVDHNELFKLLDPIGLLYTDVKV